MEAAFTIVFLFFVVAPTVFWIWALVDVVRRPSESLRRGSQLFWVLFIALTHSVGAAGYVLLGRPHRTGVASGGR